MNILVELGHPAHVHFFKNPIKIWEQAGHKVLLVTRDKDITNSLMDELKLPYKSLSKQQQVMALMFLELLYRWARIFIEIKRHKIDVAISISGISTSVPARLSGITNIIVYDTENAFISNRVSFPFADVILTPVSYRDEHPKIRRYEGFHELSYCHPRRFKPDPDKAALFGVERGASYVVLRLVKWKALHDIGAKGMSDSELLKLVSLCDRHGCRALISSERDLPSELEKYRIKGHFGDILDLMAFSRAYIGESPTMAVESAILGVPSVWISPLGGRGCGYAIEMEERYSLIRIFKSYGLAESFLDGELFTAEHRVSIAQRREQLLREKIDVAGYIAQFTVEMASKGRTCRAKD